VIAPRTTVSQTVVRGILARLLFLAIFVSFVRESCIIRIFITAACMVSSTLGIGEDMEGNSPGLFEMLSRYLLGVTEENNAVSYDNRCRFV
jgi:hypothetical protein